MAKTKVLISWAVTAQPTCVIVFPYEKNRFSHYVAHMILVTRKPAFRVLDGKNQMGLLSRREGPARFSIHHNLFITLFLESKPNSVLTILSLLYQE